MQVLTANTAGLQRAIELLAEGGSIIHATETCYGLACDATDHDAVERLFRLKNRPFHQPVSILFASIEQAKQYVQWNDNADELAREFLPGPLTIILPIRQEKIGNIFPIPSHGDGSTPTLGLRISPHPIAHALLADVDRPLVTTSANVHGQPTPYDPEIILQQYEGRHAIPEPILLDSGILPIADTSTIVDCCGNATKILRKGPLRI